MHCKQYSQHPRATRPVRCAAGNTLTEYAFIAVLVLVVVFGGLSVVGKRLGEYMGGLKDDMAHHQQLAEHRTRGITDFSLMPVGKTRTITLSNGQIVTLTYGKNTINVSGANGDSYDIPLDRSKADPTLLLSGGKLALQYGGDEADVTPVLPALPGSPAIKPDQQQIASGTTEPDGSGTIAQEGWQTTTTPPSRDTNTPSGGAKKSNNNPSKKSKSKQNNKKQGNNAGNKSVCRSVKCVDRAYNNSSKAIQKIKSFQHDSSVAPTPVSYSAPASGTLQQTSTPAKRIRSSSSSARSSSGSISKSQLPNCPQGTPGKNGIGRDNGQQCKLKPAVPGYKPPY